MSHETDTIDRLIEDRAALARLLEEHRILRDSIECAPIPYSVYDKEDRLIAWNAGYEKNHPEAFAAHWERAQRHEMTYAELIRYEIERDAAPGTTDAEISARVAERVQRQRNATGTPVVQHYRSVGYLQVVKYPLPGGAVAGIAIDVNALKDLEADLERKVAERTAELEEHRARLTEQVDHERELRGLQRQFVSMVCHEFRTPLSVIDGNASRLERRIASMPPERRTDALASIRGSVRRLVGLIEAVLSASRLENGEVIYAPGAFDLRTAVSEVLGQHCEQSSRHSMQLEIDAIPLEYFGDERLMRQVLSNLIANAIKYSPNGGDIAVRAVTQGEQLEIAVSDEGIGIPEDELDQVFERFFRARSSAGIIGTGIGLNIVREFVAMHGGQVKVTSELGKGSTFTIVLPAKGAPPASSQDAAA